MEIGNKTISRQSNIELLRIIAMFMVVAHHFVIHGGFDFSTETVSANRLWVQFLQSGGKLGVDIFVLISGYFLIESEFKLSKLLKLWLQMFTYSMTLYLIFIIWGEQSLNIGGLLKCLFPITSSYWWFASTYFMMYLLSPYINKFLRTLEQETYQRLLILLTFCWCIIPTFLSEAWQCNDLLWFIYLYAVAGYFRIYVPQRKVKGRVYLMSALALSVAAFLLIVILDFIGTRFAFVGTHALSFTDMQRLPVPIIAYLMFAGFEKIDIAPNRAINVIASATFGVYLIHDDPNVRQYIWKTLFKNAAFAESDFLIPYSIAVIVLVYIVCTVIELIRIYFIEKYYIKAVDKISVIVIGWAKNIAIRDKEMK
ncbi:MAG: acyltransferase [Butyrivibrio sp.]|nr:acyltransferase [Butyrivibrio sp.]